MAGSIDPNIPSCKPILDAHWALRYRRPMAEKTTPKSKAAQERDARLKAALKANLSKRKQQARVRGAQTGNTKEQDDG